MLEGMKFAVGPTIAARRQSCCRIGGFDRLKDYLAEDFVMGKFAADAGHGVILSSYVIEHHIGSATSAPQCGASFALGPQHAPLSSGWVTSANCSPCRCLWLSWSVPLSPHGGRCCRLLCWCASARPISFATRLAGKNQLAAAADGRSDGFCFWLAGFFGNTIVLARAALSSLCRWPFRAAGFSRGSSEEAACVISLPSSSTQIDLRAKSRCVPQKPTIHTPTATNRAAGAAPATRDHLPILQNARSTPQATAYPQKATPSNSPRPAAHACEHQRARAPRAIRKSPPARA